MRVGRMTSPALIGGEDTQVSDDHTRDDLISRKADALLRRFQKPFRRSNLRLKYAWGGTSASDLR
jgi:hypothetical protein